MPQLARINDIHQEFRGPVWTSVHDYRNYSLASFVKYWWQNLVKVSHMSDASLLLKQIALLRDRFAYW